MGTVHSQEAMQDKNQQVERVSSRHQHHAVHQGKEQAEEELDLRELFLKINRRRKAILGIFLLVAVISGLYLYQTTPRYTAQTQLTLDIRKSRVVDIEEVLSGISADASVIGTEMDIIRSSSLLARAVDNLELHRYPEFNPSLLENNDKEGPIEQFTAWLKGLWFMESEASEAISFEEEEERLIRSIVGRLSANLDVEHRRQTHTISISFTSEDPRMAARVANTLADLYLTDQLEAKFEATRRANEWLAERLENLRQEVQASEQAVKNIREQSDMIQAGSTTLLEQQISDVNAQLIQARVKRSRAEARLERAREIMRQSGSAETLAEVLDSRTIQQLRSEESSLRRKRAELSQRYGPRHPQMIQVEAEMKDLHDKLTEEVNRILESLENDVQAARAEERTLQGSLNELRAEAGRTMQTELELRELERQAESSRTLYQNFLTRFQETREQDALQRPDARIISQAEVPTSASYPRKKMTLGLSMMAGLMFGVMGAFLLETLDRGFRTGDQVEKATGLSMLGMVPLLGRIKGKPGDYVLKKPFSSMAESIRAVRSAIHLSNVDAPPGIVMATSSLPKEGKSTFCVSLSRLSALSGTKTLIIDADLRRPSLENFFPGLEIRARLEDILRGDAGPDEAIVEDSESGLHLLLAHGKAPAVGEMLGSRRMQDLLEKLRNEYDMIILDTPPVLGVTDAWGLARNVDSVVFMIRWAETPRDTVRSALKQMELLDIQVGGAVLSMVNMRQQSRYGYGGYGYYYGKYKKYYHD